ncbi:rCG21871 [Rattus norvegicus]|uniref:RCG21871 n=1 Tax=Rattus norvegicus TaxID=10116 RepID=A6J1S8_RAT|nr:rCG21871 [Rattus norvegicus]
MLGRLPASRAPPTQPPPHYFLLPSRAFQSSTCWDTAAS